MSSLRKVLVPAVGAAVVLIVAGGLVHRFFTDPAFLAANDFLSYWAAGRLAATGGDPYDADQLLHLQRAAGWPAGAIASVHWQPPWTLAVCLPVGLLPARTAQLVWLAGQGLLVGWAAVRLWRLAGGSARRVGVPLLVALAGPGTVPLVQNGQSSGLLLAGLAGWLTAVRTGRPGWAALLALGALKPHLLVPVWVAVASDAVRTRAGAVRLGVAVAAGVAAAGLVTAIDPAVWTQYLDAANRPATAAHRPLSAWQPPVLGYWLRTVVAPDQFWVQFLPVLVAAGVTGWYVRRHPVRRWHRELPWLVLGGLAAAPYSGWPFDFVLLVAAVLPAAAAVDRVGRPGLAVAAAAGWLAVTVGVHATCEAGVDQSALVWVTPTVAGGVWLVGRAARGHDLRGRT